MPPFFMDESEHQKAYIYLIRLLSKRDYSRHKLEIKLKDKGFSRESIESSIREIIELNYLREENYIESRIKGFMHKNCSISYIQNKLKEESLNIDIQLIQQVFDDSCVQELDQIENLILKKLPKSPVASISYEEKQKTKNKILRYLVSKGHSFSKSLEVLSNFI